jgi:CBS domain-containing membrane protein
VNSFKGWLQGFWPAPMNISRGEQGLSCVGAFLGLLFTAWFCRQALGGAHLWLVAPMGASAVLLFAVPSSPLAQPWSAVGGSLLAALVGVSCAKWLGPSGLAAAAAGALAIAAMFALRCLHPPGGAIALTAVLGGEEVTRLGYHFVLYPVALNVLALLLIALLFNNVLRRRYPHRPVEHGNVHKTADPIPRDRLGFTPEDLDAVLNARGELLDIARDDLEEILRQTEERAYRRRFGETRCVDIMSKDVLSLAPDATVGAALKQMHAHRLSGMPVVNPQRILQGMLYLHDVMQVGPEAEQVQVGQVMQRKVPSCSPDWPITYLIQLLSDGSVHKVPVLDGHGVLLGIVTQTDLVAALFRVSLETHPGRVAAQVV